MIVSLITAICFNFFNKLIIVLVNQVRDAIIH